MGPNAFGAMVPRRGTGRHGRTRLALPGLVGRVDTKTVARREAALAPAPGRPATDVAPPVGTGLRPRVAGTRTPPTDGVDAAGRPPYAVAAGGPVVVGPVGGHGGVGRPATAGPGVGAFLGTVHPGPRPAALGHIVPEVLVPPERRPVEEMDTRPGLEVRRPVARGGQVRPPGVAARDPALTGGETRAPGRPRPRRRAAVIRRPQDAVTAFYFSARRPFYKVREQVYAFLTKV